MGHRSTEAVAGIEKSLHDAVIDARPRGIAGTAYQDIQDQGRGAEDEGG